MTVRFAILGAGRIGQVHAKAILATAGAELVAIAEPFEAAAAAAQAEFGCELRKIDQIASSDDIDAVINFSGIDHFDALYAQVSLELVVDNLLSNALKYTDKFEWVTIDLTYSTKRASTLVLTINNAHDLLTEDECEHIFTKFVRLNSETIAGNGLGLGGVKEICERNNWIITCTSSVLPEVSKKYGKDGCVSLQLVLPFG